VSSCFAEAYSSGVAPADGTGVKPVYFFVLLGCNSNSAAYFTGVAPEDGTGVAPADGTGARPVAPADGTGVKPLCFFV